MTEPQPTNDFPVNPEELPPTPTWSMESPPPVILWYRVYCASMAVFYLLFLLLGLFMILAPALLLHLMPPSREGGVGEMAGNMVMGVAYAMLGLFFCVVYLIGAFLPARNWSWIAGLVLIAFSFTSCCCLPASIPLLLYWIKPETKAWFKSGSDSAGNDMPG